MLRCDIFCHFILFRHVASLFLAFLIVTFRQTQAPSNSVAASSSSKADSRPASPEAKHSPAPTARTHQSSHTHSAHSTSSTYGVSSSGAEPKLAPLRELKPLSSKPLPSIGGGALGSNLAHLSEKKKATEEALRRGQEQLAEQRRQEEALRNKVSNSFKAGGAWLLFWHQSIFNCVMMCR